MKRWFLILCVGGIFAFLPRSDVIAEPPTGGETMEVPKADLERLLAALQTLRAQVKYERDRANICGASWDVFRGFPPPSE